MIFADDYFPFSFVNNGKLILQPVVEGREWDGTSWHKFGITIDLSTFPESVLGNTYIPGFDESTGSVFGEVVFGGSHFGGGDHPGGLDPIPRYTPAVGAGTCYPIGMSLEDVSMWYWRIKSIKTSLITLEGPFVDDIRFPDNVDGVVTVTTPLYGYRYGLYKSGKITDIPSPYQYRDLTEQELAVGQNGYNYIFTDPDRQVYTATELETEEGPLFFNIFELTGAGGLATEVVWLPRLVKCDGLYYPLMDAGDGWASNQSWGQAISNLDGSGFQQIYGTFTIGYSSLSIDLTYTPEDHSFVCNASYSDPGFSASSEMHIEPDRYFTYGGIYNEDTGERV